MTATATVSGIKGKLITLNCGTQSECQSCKGSAFCNIKEQEFEAINNNNLELKKDDKVEFYLPPGKTVFAGFIVLIMPLILFIIMFLIADKILNISSEGVKVLYGLGGIAVGFSINILLNKINIYKNMPEIIKKI